MRILFITDNFPPEVNAPATRTFEHCVEWVKMGAEVTVVTCAPNSPQGKVYPGYRNKLYSVEDSHGIKVVRVWSYITRNEGFVRRTLDYLSFAATSFLAGLTISCDVIVATSPQFFTTFSGFALSRLKHVPWIFELRDLWPESIRTVGALQNSPLLDFLERIELFLYKDATLVVALTERFKQNLIKRKIFADKIKVVTNGANTDLFTSREKNPDLLKKHQLTGKFVVAYIGTHGLAHSLEFIVSCLELVEDPSIHFLFIGDGAKKANIIELADRKGLSNITFLAPVQKDLVPEYMSLADIALVPLLKSDTFTTVIPSKIFEAAAMKIPILLGVEGQAQEIIEGYKAGICYEPENQREFLEKLQLIKNDRRLYLELQEGCENLAKAFDRRHLAKELYNIIEGAASSTRYT